MPDLDDEEEDGDGDEDGDGQGQEDSYKVGSFVVAIYENVWYIAQVEGEELEEETKGFTLLKYMNKVGRNEFTWGVRKDRLKGKTFNGDIIMCVEGGPVPVSSRCLGLDKISLKKVDELIRVLWSIIPDFLLFLKKMCTLKLDEGGSMVSITS